MANASPPVAVEAAPVQAGPPPKSKVRSAIGWSYVLTAGRVGSSIVVTFLLAMLLGPDEFGILTMALVLVMIAQTILQQGLVSAIVQRDKLTGAHLDAAFGVLAIAGFGVAALVAAISPLWALMYREPRLTLVCVALAPLVLMQGLATVPEAVLRRELQFRAVAIRTLLAAVLSGVVGIALAVAGAGIWALVAQQLVNALIGLIVLWIVCPWRPSRRIRLGAIRELWTFSLHSANAGLGVLLSNRADLIFTGLFFGPIATGIYRLAARLPDMLVDVTVRSLQQVALPSLSRHQNDRTAFVNHLVQLQHLGAIVGLPVLGVLAATAGPLVGFLGPQWAGTEVPLQVLCLFGAVNVYGVLLGPALQAIGQPGKLAAISWARGLLGVATFAALGTLFGSANPAAQATAIAMAGVCLQVVVNAVSIWVTVRRAAGASVLRFLLPTLPAVVAATAAALVPYGLNRLGADELPPLVGVMVLGAAGGLTAAAILWTTDRRVRDLVRKRLPRRFRRPSHPPRSA
ncbi:lipopolysaccharide biosynthesis protein [Polymorphospora rubra]|uniref:lipopolysaccharide biosynthesis protein n=1 Tax=Polymorphospora rubra TaxID=338584 RepID=UPI00340E92A1